MHARSAWTSSARLAVIAASVALALAACAPTPAPVSDPREILSLALANLRAATTVHLEVSVDGSVSLTPILPGPGGAGGSLGLTGTRAEGDLDLGGDRADVHFEVPALLGMTGELRALGADVYLSSSLTSRGWHRLAAGDLPLGIGQPAAALDAVTTWLERPGVVPVRLDDAACRAGTCFVVRVAVGADELTAVASGAPAIGPVPGDASLTLELRVERTSLVLSDAALEIDLGDGGSLEVDIGFSAWGRPVSIVRPPDSEIVEGPLLP